MTVPQIPTERRRLIGQAAKAKQAAAADPMPAIELVARRHVLAGLARYLAAQVAAARAGAAHPELIEPEERRYLAAQLRILRRMEARARDQLAELDRRDDEARRALRLGRGTA